MMKGKLQNIHPLGMTIIIGTLFARFATSMSIPFLAIYLTTVKGVSAGMTGAIIGTSALVGVFASFIGSIRPKHDYNMVHDRLGVCIYRFFICKSCSKFLFIKCFEWIMSVFF